MAYLTFVTVVLACSMLNPLEESGNVGCALFHLKQVYCKLKIDATAASFI